MLLSLGKLGCANGLVEGTSQHLHPVCNISKPTFAPSLTPQREWLKARLVVARDCYPVRLAGCGSGAWSTSTHLPGCVRPAFGGSTERQLRHLAGHEFWLLASAQTGSNLF